VHGWRAIGGEVNYPSLARLDGSAHMARLELTRNLWEEFGDCRRFTGSDDAVRHAALEVTVWSSDGERTRGHLAKLARRCYHTLRDTGDLAYAAAA
jgi:hypothetical protein